MSGHSKWSNIKHQKAMTDVAKAAAFTRASRGITLAVREGGGITNPDDNFHLRLAIEKAHDVNMPKENIERAIDKAKGDGANALTQETYEGYAPHGVAILIECATDSKQRTVGFIKQYLDHAGGSMASPGAVSYLFKRQGVITIPKSVAYDTVFSIACDAGAVDVIELTDLIEVYTHPEQLAIVKRMFEEKKILIDTVALVMQPISLISLPENQRTDVEELIDRLEELDDVQQVYSNLE
jgi:YebC/PmpR family DNA-binding regulatory protein